MSANRTASSHLENVIKTSMLFSPLKPSGYCGSALKDSTFCPHSTFMWFIGAFAEFRKATISFVMPVRPSVYPAVTTRLPLDGF